MRGCFSWLLTGLAFIGLALMAAGYARSSAAFWSHPLVEPCCSEADGFKASWVAGTGQDGQDFAIVKVEGVFPKSAWGAHLIGKVYTVKRDKWRNVPVPTPDGGAVLFIRPSDEQVLCFVRGLEI